MKQWKQHTRRGFALLLALVMCLGMLQLTVYASELELPDGPPQSVETVDSESASVSGTTGGDESAKEPAADEDAKEPAVDEDTKEPAADEDTKEPAVDEDTKEPAADEDAKEPAVDEDTKEPAADEDAKEPDAVQPAPDQPQPPAVKPEADEAVEELVKLLAPLYVPASFRGWSPTAEVKSRLAEANEAYQALSDEQKATVREKTSAKVEAMNRGVAWLAIREIALPAPDSIDLSYREEVAGWMQACEALTPEQFVYIQDEGAYKQLLDAAARIEAKEETFDDSRFRQVFSNLEKWTSISYQELDDAEWDVKSMGRTIELLSRVTRAALEASGDLAAAEVLMEAVQARIEEVKASQVVDEAAVTAYQEICRAARSCIDWFNWDVKEGKAEELRGFLLKSYELYRSMNELTQQAAEEYYYDYLYDAEDILFSYDQNAVKNLIAALPSLQGLAAEDAEAVQAARAAYNALVKMTGEGGIWNGWNLDMSTEVDRLKASELVVGVLSLPEVLTAADENTVQGLLLLARSLSDEHAAVFAERGLQEKLAAAEQAVKDAIQADKDAAKDDGAKSKEQLEAIQKAIFDAEGAVTIDLTAYATAAGVEVLTAGAPIVIPDGKDITITGTAKLSRTDDSVNLIQVERGGRLTLEAVSFVGGRQESGGRSAVLCAGELIICEGAVLSGFSAENGGAVRVVDGGALTLAGGTLTGNYAANSGGAVHITGDSRFTMTAGRISGNTAGTYGGGIAIGVGRGAAFLAPEAMVPQGNVVLSGGEISSNAAAIGGGVYVNGNNDAVSYLTLLHVSIDGNTAALGQLDEILGGGVYFCAEGKGAMYATSGGLITGNAVSGGEGWGRDFFTAAPSQGNGAGKIHLATHLPDGTPVVWTDETTGQALPGAAFHSWVEETLGKGHHVALTSGTEGIFAAALTITGNRAQWGGGVGCNGFLQIGEDQDVSLSIVKEWRNDSQQNRPAFITVQVRMDGKDLETVILSPENGWQATLTDLPSGHIYTAEEIDVPDGYILASTAAVTEGRVTTITIVNTRPNEPEEPDRPDEPDEPDRPVPPPDEPEIPEPEVPLTEVPEVDIPLTDLPSEEEIPEEEVPLAEVPLTGDHASLWGMALLSALGMVWLALTRKREKVV